MIVGMNHFTIIAINEKETLDFYVGILGLRVGPRPDLGFPGAWLYGPGEHAILHIYFERPVPDKAAGVIDHMAFSASGLAETKLKLENAKIPFELKQQAGGGVWQMFFRDPNGAKVELDFPPTAASSIRQLNGG